MGREKVEPYRVTIAEVLVRANAPIPADQLLWLMQAKIPSLTLSILNSTLQTMNEQGLTRSRKCPDEPYYMEHWLVSIEDKLIFLP